jgi:hypothetical protein|tara:strand:- start:827 stop:1072 length:246 start_codon:yes stop_codon:yes gene_type:complete
MKKLQIITGCDYKVTNKLTKQVHLFNAQELANFVFKNDFKKYHIQELGKETLLDKTPEFVLWIMFIVLGFSSFCLYLQLNY